MVKKAFYPIHLFIIAGVLVFSGCAASGQDNNQSGASANKKQEQTKQEQNNGKQPSKEMQEKFAAPPTDFNDQASTNLKIESTKNVTRINEEQTTRAATLVSQTIWPATHKENQPGTVILVPEGQWQISMASADLIHHPNNGPVLFTKKDAVPQETLDEIKRLRPVGNEDGTQIMVMGDVSENVLKQLEEYKVQHIEGTDPAKFAADIDRVYAEVAGEVPESVIIVSPEEKSKLFSLPAVNWIAHMPEPVLFVNKDDIPEATLAALEVRKKKPNMYILGPESVISKKVEEQLSEIGTVTRIAGEDPVSNAISFAQFKDQDTGFGWGMNEPGHGLSFVSTETPELAIAAAPFSHLGKHAPLIWLENGQPHEDIYKFLASIRPTFTNNPQDGPFNHAFMTGTFDQISFKTQGIIDEKLEITNAGGGGHGGH